MNDLIKKTESGEDLGDQEVFTAVEFLLDEDADVDKKAQFLESLAESKIFSHYSLKLRIFSN